MQEYERLGFLDALASLELGQELTDRELQIWSGCLKVISRCSQSSLQGLSKSSQCVSNFFHRVLLSSFNDKRDVNNKKEGEDFESFGRANMEKCAKAGKINEKII